MSQYGDDEYVSVSSDEWRKARKEHRCDACHEAILPSHRYHRTWFIFDGNPHVYVRCARCQAIHAHLRAKINESGECDEYCDDQLNCGHEYRERWNEDPPPEIAALAFWRPGDPMPGIAK